MGVLLVSATDRIIDLHVGDGSNGPGGRVWLEPMPVSIGAAPAWGRPPIARLRAHGQRGYPASITPAQAREIADALTTWADLADRTAAGR
jgi:hypothetical protein